MSGGEQQMLAIVMRADEPAPRLLLLDELSLGLAPTIQQIFDTIEQLREQGMTIFLVGWQRQPCAVSPTAVMCWKTHYVVLS